MTCKLLLFPPLWRSTCSYLIRYMSPYIAYCGRRGTLGKGAGREPEGQSGVVFVVVFVVMCRSFWVSALMQRFLVLFYISFIYLLLHFFCCFQILLGHWQVSSAIIHLSARQPFPFCIACNCWFERRFNIYKQYMWKFTFDVKCILFWRGRRNFQMRRWMSNCVCTSLWPLNNISVGNQTYIRYETIFTLWMIKPLAVETDSLVITHFFARTALWTGTTL